jgi:hypothetical protein
MFAINTSLARRQGRPMTDSYLQPPDVTPLPDYPCDRHAIRPYGVFHGDQLRAYLFLYRAGELALVSSILGHGAYLADNIMYLLVAEMLEVESAYGPGTVVYNRHDSGTDGLRFFKERVGFTATEVLWAL